MSTIYSVLNFLNVYPVAYTLDQRDFKRKLKLRRTAIFIHLFIYLYQATKPINIINSSNSYKLGLVFIVCQLLNFNKSRSTPTTVIGDRPPLL